MIGAAPDLRADVVAATAGATDRIARSVAKARIASALFARDRRVTFGRYQLLEQVGAGGMGVVWGAWDPELERRVALKVLHPSATRDRERVLREGQALAKLSHPNVIPIFDVGVVDDQVYLVMEWVRGATLRAFEAEPREARAIVDVYRQACAGLVAAHGAGVVHRDFKPDNAIVGDDGRVRVLDFGLAAPLEAAHAPAGRVAGTPRYMAPEQAAGGAVDASADQFAFCVSLRDALAAHGRATPRWLATIVARGTAAEPAARFSSMVALATALAMDPARAWRRRGVVAVALAGAAAAFVVGRARANAPPAPRCVGAEAELARRWNPEVRGAMTAHVSGLGPFGAHEAEPLAGELDTYARGWIAARTQTCLAHDRGELPPAQYARRVGCLARAGAALASAAEAMTETTPAALGGALVAARSLPSTDGCAGEDGATVAPPPDAIAARVVEIGGEVERARVLAMAASPRASEVADAAVVAARGTGYAPLLARALATQGWARRPGDRAASAALLAEAFHAALRAGDDVLAVEAYARARFVASRAPDFAPVEAERVMVEELGARSADTGRFALALLYNNLATERLVADDRAGARDLLRRALATWQPPIGDAAQDLELLVVPRNLALVEDDPERRAVLSREAAVGYERVLGAAHPWTINARIQLAVLTPDAGAAARAFAATCAAIPAWHPALREGCAYEAGWLAIQRGAPDEAAAMMAIAQGDVTGGERRAQLQIASAYLVVATDPARAVADMARLAAELADGSGWWNHADAADALAVVALAEEARGRAAAATRAWGRSLALLADQPSLARRREYAADMLSR
jgi:hypothetical protein